MPKYVPNALHEFQPPYPRIPQHVPHKLERSNYEAKTQCDKRGISLEILPEHRVRKIQEVVVKFIYYNRAVNPSLLVAFGSIAADK